MSTTPLSWTKATEEGPLVVSAIASPAIRYCLYRLPDGLQVVRFIRQGGADVHWPVQSNVKDQGEAQALAQTDWDNIHG